MQTGKSLERKKKTMGTVKNKIFILHGWTYSTEKWTQFLDLIKQKGLDVELLKIPGLTAPIKNPWEITDYVNWLKKIVEKENEKVILIGHSNGGRISLWFANKYPQLVKQLILIDSAGIYHDDLAIRVKRFVFKSIAKIGKKITSSKLVENILYKTARETDYKESSPVMKQTIRNLFRSDKFLNSTAIKIPTLIIWGKKDSVTPLADGILMNNKIKNSKLEIIETAHHSPQFTDPEKVVKLIYEHL